MFSQTLIRSPQGSGFFTPFHIHGQLSKDVNQIEEEDDDSIQFGDSYLSDEATTVFVDYKVDIHDTLYGIALSHNINLNILKQDNGLSSDMVHAGQTLKIRSKRKSEESSPIDTKRLREKLTSRANIEAGAQHQEDDFFKNGVGLSYSTSKGDIQGTIQLENSVLRFIPNQNKTTSSKGVGENLEKFSVCIDLRDIEECNLVVVPHPQCEEIYEETKEYVKDYLLQIILKHHGQNSFGKYFDRLFLNLKKQGTPYSCIYFKAENKLNGKQPVTNKFKHTLIQDLQDFILSSKASASVDDSKPSMTKIPFVEFLYDKIDHQDSELLRKLLKKKVLAENLNFTGQLAPKKKYQTFLTRKIASALKHFSENFKQSASEILSADQFGQIFQSIPEIYQTLQWQLKYSNQLHGTSYSTLLKKTKDANPLIIIIKDEHGFVFGTYMSQKLAWSKSYYGTGETFLFTFRDLDDVTIFNWTKKNSMFVNANEEGILFGSGPHYGLWLNNDMTKGRSERCDTFDNPILSFETEFKIIKMEVWSAVEST